MKMAQLGHNQKYPMENTLFFRMHIHLHLDDAFGILSQL